MDSKRQYGWVLLILGLGTFVMLGIILYQSNFHLDREDLFPLILFSSVGVVATIGGIKLLE